MKSNPKVTDTHIYFPNALYKKVQRLAKDQQRTISAEIVRAVEAHVETWSKWKRDKSVPRGHGYMD